MIMLARFIFTFWVIVIALATVGCQQSPIICLGASLTQGKGAQAGHDYPSQLRKMVNVPVINAGISGNTTRDELVRLDHDVLTHNPQMVIITQRNNDCRKNISKQETLKNLDTMIDKIQRHGAIAVLVTFQHNDSKCSYMDDFKKLMHRKQGLLIDNVLNDVKSNPQYMHDLVHPNSVGYLLLAKRVYKAINPYLNTTRLLRFNRSSGRTDRVTECPVEPALTGPGPRKA